MGAIFINKDGQKRKWSSVNVALDVWLMNNKFSLNAAETNSVICKGIINTALFSNEFSKKT